MSHRVNIQWFICFARIAERSCDVALRAQATELLMRQVSYFLSVREAIFSKRGIYIKNECALSFNSKTGHAMAPTFLNVWIYYIPLGSLNVWIYYIRFGSLNVWIYYIRYRSINSMRQSLLVLDEFRSFL